MFPLVHIYAATEVSKKKTPLLVIGSVLPDFVWIDRKNFSPDKLHDNLDDFYLYIKTKHPEMLDLALGMKLHSNKLGADKYSHFYKGGYSYVKGRELLSDINNLVESEDDKRKSDLSHNFMEAALDLDLINKRPDLLKTYEDSLSKVDLGKISKVLSKYCNVDYEIVDKAVRELFETVVPNKLSTDEQIAEKALPRMIRLSFDQDVDTKLVLSILRKAVKISEVDCEKLFDEIISGMKKDFAEFS